MSYFSNYSRVASQRDIQLNFVRTAVTCIACSDELTVFVTVNGRLYVAPVGSVSARRGVFFTNLISFGFFFFFRSLLNEIF